MTQLRMTSSVAIHRCAEDVFAYAADFRRAAEWRDEVVASTMSPSGPMRPGTLLHEEARVAGRGVVTDSVVEVYEPPHRFTFTHLSGPLPVRGEYRVTPVGDGAQLRYDLTVDLRGGWALFAPILRLSGPRMMARSLDELRFRLEASVPTRTPDLVGACP
jgi:hypothetical protein